MRDTIATPLLWILFILSVSPIAGQKALSIDLSGEWRQSVDDRPTYAAADFDDRGWKTVRLPWTVSSERGVFWLRRSARLPVGADRSRVVLCLGPVRETYEVFVNGRQVGSTGPFFNDRFDELAQSRSFPLAAEALGRDEQVQIALRTRRP